MNLTDLSFGLLPTQLLAIIIALSILLYAIAANLGWLLQHRQAPGAWEGRLAWLRSSRIVRVLKELARWLYYLGLPYASLMVGYDTVRALGVWNLDWLGSAIPAILSAVGSIFVVLWIWRPYAQVQHPHAIDESRWNWARHAIESLYQQAHWSFYRSGPILWIGDLYWGSLLGLGLAYIEGWTNPSVRAGTREVTRADAPLWTGTLAVITTVVYIYTQNFWYCLVIHLLLDLGFRGIIGFPRVSARDHIRMELYEWARSARGSDSSTADSMGSTDENSSSFFGAGGSLFGERESIFDFEGGSFGAPGDGGSEYSPDSSDVKPEAEDANPGGADEGDK